MSDLSFVRPGASRIIYIPVGNINIGGVILILWANKNIRGVNKNIFRKFEEYIYWAGNINIEVAIINIPVRQKIFTVLRDGPSREQGLGGARASVWLPTSRREHRRANRLHVLHESFLSTHVSRTDSRTAYNRIGS